MYNLTNREIALKFLGCFCAGDVNGLAPLLAEDLQFKGPLETALCLTEGPTGKHAVAQLEDLLGNMLWLSWRTYWETRCGSAGGPTVKRAALDPAAMA